MSFNRVLAALILGYAGYRVFEWGKTKILNPINNPVPSNIVMGVRA